MNTANALFKRTFSIPKIFSLVLLFVIVRVSIEILLLDYSIYTQTIGYFKNYARFYLENIYYFCFLFLILSTFVSFITGQTFKKVANFGLRLAPFILTPPIVDHFLFDRTDGYTYGTVGHFLENVLTFSWASGDTGHGISLLVTFASIIIAAYVWTQTKSPAKTAVSLFFTSFAVMVISTPDLFFGEGRGDYLYDYFLPAYYFFPFLLAISLFYRNYARDKFYAIMSNLRHERALMFVSAATVGFFVVFSPGDLMVILSNFSYSVLCTAISVLFAWWFAVAINDIYDEKIDTISNPSRLIPQKILSKNEYALIACVFAFFSASFAAAVNMAVFISSLLWIILGIVYSVPPIRLRKNLFGNVVIGTAMVLSFIMGIFTSWKWSLDILFFEKNIAFYALLFLFTVTTTTSKDLRDIKGDRSAGVKNIFTKFGEVRGMQIVNIINILAFNSAPLIAGSPSLFAITVPWSIITGYLYNKKRSEHVMYISGAMLLVILFTAIYY